ncbi:MAG: spore maturation protein [Clostridia bacterium]|nr:spore maturation protein [Clostridia bacterium]
MKDLSDYILPTIVVLIVLYGGFKGVDVFNVFIDGAKSGFKTVFNIIPSLIALLLSINMLKASGGLDVLLSLLSPIGDFLGIPRDIIPLTILSPISGSGSLGVYESILKDFGPDSFIGRCASVMMGSTETTFYTLALYYGSIGVKKTRHTVPSALCADFTSFILSPRFVRIFFR